MFRVSLVLMLMCVFLSAHVFAEVSVTDNSVIGDAATGSSLRSAVSLTSNSQEESIKSQEVIDNISDKTQRLVNDHLFNLRQANITESYNRQLARLIVSQEREMSDLNEQIDSIQATERAMLPLLNVMVGQLAQFISGDLPFLPEEREERVAKLTGLLDRSDVSVAEKYRQILEAYLVEVGYGRTIGAYTGPLLNDSSSTHVNYLRMGRVALYYQSLNGRESGVWLPALDRWQELDSEQNLVLTKALHIAQQQRVPELLELPVPAVSSSLDQQAAR